ncbi:molybdopterin-binding protein [Rhizobium sp. P32RR-XVIII]|uniref:molybdopterin-binding protein n=1 Tax=Rhizobium sp. P32RR-XVIII TaxID=2726738 RepID=UPI001FEF684E|nr:molybdopterin-binding protein [Rhizobium sp. P32RR-XVIII]
MFSTLTYPPGSGRGDAGSLGFPEGAELREPREWLARGQLYNSNRTMISSILAGEPWAKVVDYGIVPDSRAALGEVLGEAAKSCDVLVTTGGVSAGEEDHIVGALGDHGVDHIFRCLGCRSITISRLAIGSLVGVPAWS